MKTENKNRRWWAFLLVLIVVGALLGLFYLPRMAVAGEEGICSGCGVATLSISYHDIGYACGEMAAEILLEGADVSQMAVRYAPQFTKEYNSEICQALSITVPDDYVAIG